MPVNLAKKKVLGVLAVLKNCRGWQKRAEAQEGQSAVEFLMTLPIILALFFFVVQANLIFSMGHQGAWASYAAARYWLVAREPNPLVVQQEVVKPILRGTAWGGVRWESDNLPDSQKTGGRVVFELGKMDTALPYARKMLGNVQWEIPTHLGANEWVAGKQGDGECPECWDRTTARERTDNNIDDF